MFVSDSVDSVNIFEVYRAMRRSILKHRLLHAFNGTSQNFKGLIRNFIRERRKNLTGLHLKVSLLENNPFIVIKNQVNIFKIKNYTYK